MQTELGDAYTGCCCCLESLRFLDSKNMTPSEGVAAVMRGHLGACCHYSNIPTFKRES
jgi:hypothetical protein